MSGKISLAWNVFKGVFKSPATIGYAGGSYSLDEHVRGMLRYDVSQCVVCGLCMKDCPTGAIRIINNGTREEKDIHAYLDTGRCIFCGQCADSCAKHCISCSSDSDLAKFDRKDLVVEL